MISKKTKKANEEYQNKRSYEAYLKWRDNLSERFGLDEKMPFDKYVEQVHNLKIYGRKDGKGLKNIARTMAFADRTFSVSQAKNIYEFINDDTKKSENINRQYRNYLKKNKFQSVEDILALGKITRKEISIGAGAPIKVVSARQQAILMLRKAGYKTREIIRILY